jgi:hypothetical protein
MKAFHKIISLVLVLNVLFSTVGLSCNAHYCGGKLSSLTYFTKAKCCCGDKEDDKDSCCKNEVTVVQYKNDFIVSQNVLPVKPEITTSIFIVNPFLSDAFNCTDNYFIPTIHQSKCDYHSPPLYLKNSVFII